MGFKEARQQAIRAITEGRIQHEARAQIDEKNLLLTGDVTPAQVIRMLLACRGTQHRCSPHHQDAGIDVHEFKPEASLVPGQRRRRWYIKLYFLQPDVWFISVHESK